MSDKNKYWIFLLSCRIFRMRDIFLHFINKKNVRYDWADPVEYLEISCRITPDWSHQSFHTLIVLPFPISHYVDSLIADQFWTTFFHKVESWTLEIILARLLLPLSYFHITTCQHILLSPAINFQSILNKHALFMSIKFLKPIPLMLLGCKRVFHLTA